ncbi:hypothetical protein NSPZN2_30652 [Nitrospira defluvii]|uniref:Uncharacterized protein n=1 Tax=Nitrospira defluvii TaxID=330214 RepID=A0ABM8RMQ1_9BACT|nr:hypothetical protein NSPZN2_30652 [Nitrospira defluvii]
MFARESGATRPRSGSSVVNTKVWTGLSVGRGNTQAVNVHAAKTTINLLRA